MTSGSSMLAMTWSFPPQRVPASIPSFAFAGYTVEPEC
jgi:hypothetical protein